jgi:hypothetical protein
MFSTLFGIEMILHLPNELIRVKAYLSPFTSTILRKMKSETTLPEQLLILTASATLEMSPQHLYFTPFTSIINSTIFAPTEK